MSDIDVAAIAAVLDKVHKTPASPRTDISGSLGVLTWRTALSVTGAGYLHMLSHHNTSSATYVWYRVTVDGGTAQLVGDTAGLGLYAAGKYGTSYSGCLPLGRVRFKKSLLVEVYNNSSAGGRTVVTYSLE